MIWKFLPWLWKGDYRTSIEVKDRAIICLNENNERIFPESHDTPFLWAGFDDPGHGLSAGHLAAIEAFARAFKDDRGVVVHCYGGRNRSSAISWFLMRRMGMSNNQVDDIFRCDNSNIGIRPELAMKIYQITGYEYRGHWLD